MNYCFLQYQNTLGNVLEECAIKENSSIISDPNGYYYGHLAPKMITKFLYLYESYLMSSPVLSELNCLHFHDLSLLLPLFYCYLLLMFSSA